MRKKKYLQRLITVIFLLIILPILLFLVYFWKVSYEKMVAYNDAYYEKAVNYYVRALDQKIASLKHQAALVMVNSKKSTDLLYERKTESNLTQKWYYMLILELKNKYNEHGVSNIGIYYYGQDTVVLDSGTISPEKFLRNYSPVVDETELGQPFLSKDRYKNMKTILSISNDQDGNGNLLVGFCYELGRNREPALVFYRITSTDLNSILETFSGYGGLDCYLMETENQRYIKLGEAKQDVGMDSSVTSLQLEAESVLGGLKIVGRLNANSPYNYSSVFYYETRILIILLIVIILLSFVCVLLLLYHPIRKITIGLKNSKGDLDAIEAALLTRQEKIEEQEMQLMDLLMEHLLHGVPINPALPQVTRLKSKGDYYCVFLLPNKILLSEMEKIMKQQAMELFRASFFQTDWEDHKSTIFIFFMEEDRVAEIKEWLKLSTTAKEEEPTVADTVYGGKMVECLDDITKSLQFCYREIKEQNNYEKKAYVKEQESLNNEKKQLELRGHILDYIEKHYMEPDLSQGRVGEHFKLSTYSVSRMFKNQIGIGFVEYINGKRVELAKTFLAESEASIHETAVKTGFNNDNNFFKVFKAHVGISPASYREMRNNGILY